LLPLKIGRNNFYQKISYEVFTVHFSPAKVSPRAAEALAEAQRRRGSPFITLSSKIYLEAALDWNSGVLYFATKDLNIKEKV
jgi:hypothetical protein